MGGADRQLVRHWVDRYGTQEVRQWCLEVWNEPNLEAFWTGGRDGYYALYRTTAQAIKKIDLPGLRVVALWRVCNMTSSDQQPIVLITGATGNSGGSLAEAPGQACW